MALFLWLLGMAAAICMTACHYKRIELCKSIIVGTGLYFSNYILISGLLIWMNHFNIIRCEVITICIEMAAIGIMLLRGYRMPKLKLNITAYIPLTVLLIIIAILSGMAGAGFYGTDQDEGLYAIRAMYYMNDYNDNIIDFPEYYTIEDSNCRKHYEEKIDGMVGFYQQSAIGEADYSSLSGVTHGVNTFPALLGLWGRMFSLHNMQGILTVMLMILTANVWLICRNMGFKKFLSFMAAVFTGLCPIVMWSSKNILTEIVVAMLLSLFYELITENNRSNTALVSAVPICAFCFVHVTAMMLMPLIAIVYMLQYCYTKESGYIKAFIGTLLSFAAGFTMMMTTARRYTVNNMQMLFKKSGGLLNEDNLVVFVWAAVFVAIAAICLKIDIEALFPSVRRKTRRLIKRLYGSERGIYAFFRKYIYVAITLVTVALLVLTFIKDVKDELWTMKLSFLCYLFTTGFIILPCAIIGAIVLSRHIRHNRNYGTFVLSAMYVLVVYCVLVWPNIYYYFYFARYFTPFVFVIVIAGCILLDYFSWRILAPVMCVCMGITIWQGSIIYREQDLTYCSYENIESLVSCISDKDAVILLDQGYNLANLFYLPLQAMTEADIYFAKPENLQAVTELYKAGHDDVFIVLYDVGYINEDSGSWRYVYRTMMHSQVYDIFVDKGMPYAKEILPLDSPLALMMYTAQPAGPQQ